MIIGCGDVGQRIAGLVGREWKVHGVARSTATAQRIRAAGAVALPADPPRRRRLQDLAEWVVYGAPPGPARERTAQANAAAGGAGDDPVDMASAGGPAGSADRADGLTRLWAARLAGRPRRGRPFRLVYLSTTGVYGDRHGRLTEETTPARPITDRARRRVAAERWLRRTAPASPGVGVRILRVPGIYAPDRLPLERIRRRIPALRPEDDVQTNHVHADDLARIVRAALLRGSAQRTFNAVDDTVLPMGDYLDALAAWAGLPPPPRLDRAALLARVSPMRATFMSESRRLSNRRMKRELRLSLRYPTVAAFLAANRPPAEGGSSLPI